MSRASNGRRARAPRPLPAGLRMCETCGEVRGKTWAGQLSVCLCQGIRCRFCGEVRRRPISDYFDPADGKFWHVPWFAAMNHACARAGNSGRPGTWEILETDEDMRTYANTLTEIARQDVLERVELRRRQTEGEQLTAAELRKIDGQHATFYSIGRPGRRRS